MYETITDLWVTQFIRKKKKQQTSFFVVGKNHLSDPFTLDFHEEQIGYCKSSLIRLLFHQTEMELLQPEQPAVNISS